MKNITYEKALDKLEKIVEELERGSIPLEKSLELFEEANKLAVYCKNCLDTAEQKIVRLTEDGSEEDDFE
ncbi:MAG: exodeoxyribonuclease VII small subunit [Clostridia bacterium]|nr:exodeoxyribonuclease VII small subunit [Clostridia bacterium]